MKVTALIRILHRGARTGIAGFAISAAVFGYPGAENLYEKSLLLRPSQATEHERFHSHVDHSLRMFSPRFINAHGATLLDEPADGSLHDPAAVEVLEPLGVAGAADDVQMETASRSQCFNPRDQGARIACVGPDLGQAAIAANAAAQQGLGPIAVQFIGRSHLDAQKQAQDFDQDLTFASRSLLAGVVAAHSSLVPELDRLTVEDGGGGSGLASVGLADLGAQGVTDPLPDTHLDPEATDTLGGRLGTVLFGQHAPRATGPPQRGDSIDHHVSVRGPPRLGSHGQQRAQEVPVVIGQLGRTEHPELVPEVRRTVSSFFSSCVTQLRPITYVLRHHAQPSFRAGSNNRQPAAASLALVSTAVPPATWVLGSASTLRMCTVAFSFTTVAALVPAAMPSLAGAAVFSPVFAQVTFDSAVEHFLGLIAKVLILLGIAVVFYGGWMVSQGKTADGVTAIVGGFLMVSAVLVTRLLAQYVGVTF